MQVCNIAWFIAESIHLLLLHNAECYTILKAWFLAYKMYDYSYVYLYIFMYIKRWSNTFLYMHKYSHINKIIVLLENKPLGKYNSTNDHVCMLKTHI